MGRLTTHVLDTSRGCPAQGVALELTRLRGEGAQAQWEPLRQTQTNADGRCDAPLLEGAEFQAGRYALAFALSAYFAAQGVELAEPPFLERVVIHFGISDPQTHYHVPLLVSPYGYTTYRGS